MANKLSLLFYILLSFSILINLAAAQTVHTGTGQAALVKVYNINEKSKIWATVFVNEQYGLGAGMFKNGRILPPLIRGKWGKVDTHQAQILIYEFIANAESKYPGAVRRISQLRALPLLFYPDTYLFEGVATMASGQKGLILFIKHGREIIQLSGSSDIIHNINKNFGIQLDTKEKAGQYLRFFCAAIQSELGPFLIVESLNELRFSNNLNDVRDRLSNLDIRSLNIGLNEEKNEWQVSGSVVYGKGIWSVIFTIKHDGIVRMDDDVSIESKLPLRQISYENGVIIEHPRNSPALIWPQIRNEQKISKKRKG